MTYKICGTNHLQSKQSIIKEIEDFQPDIIGIELCKIREYIYINKIPQNQEADKKDESLLGKISNAINKKAKEENQIYGQDMYTALQYAIDKKLPYVLVDKNIQEIKELFQKIPANELQGFIHELAIFDKQTIAQSTVNEQEFLNKLKTNFPISFEILITLREQEIALNILKTIVKYPNEKFIVFVGKGHLESIKNILGMKDGK
jgi:pheromone shutdown protein TraB